MKKGRIACLALGLPAAILTHVWLFGAEHVLGGRLHGAVVDLAICATLGTVVTILAMALLRSTRVLPNAGFVAVAAAGWFAAIELFEPAHSVAALPAAVTLMVSACLVTLALRSFCGAAVFVAEALATPLGPNGAARPVTLLGLKAQAKFPSPLAFSLFSRPPPHVA